MMISGSFCTTAYSNYPRHSDQCLKLVLRLRNPKIWVVIEFKRGSFACSLTSSGTSVSNSIARSFTWAPLSAPALPLRADDVQMLMGSCLPCACGALFSIFPRLVFLPLPLPRFLEAPQGVMTRRWSTFPLLFSVSRSRSGEIYSSGWGRHTLGCVSGMHERLSIVRRYEFYFPSESLSVNSQ